MTLILTIAPLLAGLTIVALALIKKLKPQEAMEARKLNEEVKS